MAQQYRKAFLFIPFVRVLTDNLPVFLPFDNLPGMHCPVRTRAPGNSL